MSPIHYVRGFALFSVMFVLVVIWFYDYPQRKTVLGFSTLNTGLPSSSPKNADNDSVNSLPKAPRTSSTDPNRDELRSVNLRELQSAVQEEMRRLLVLKEAPNIASFPTVTPVTCPRLWAGGDDAEYVQKAASIRRNRTRTSRDVLVSTLNCTHYVLNQGFRLADVSPEETSFPLAFSLMVYKDLEQVERLLRAVYRPHNVYCVHADRKSSESFQSSLRLIVGCLPNMHMLDTAIDVQWGKFSVLEPEIQCMRMLWSHAVRWRYYINLTGQEFPLKTNKELVTILKALKGANDITGTHDPLYRVRWNSVLPAPYDLTVSKGSVHIISSRDFVDYVLHSRVSRDLQKWVRGVYIPDETFFNTINHNPKLGVPGSFTGNIDRRREGAGSISRYKQWSTKPGDICSGKWIRSICILGVEDLPRLTQSPQLFANKFFFDFQPAAYDCLEEWYFHKVHLENVGHPLPLNVSFYEHLDIVKYRYTGRVQIE